MENALKATASPSAMNESLLDIVELPFSQKSVLSKFGGGGPDAGFKPGVRVFGILATYKPLGSED
jgi:hypothetical protein